MLTSSPGLVIKTEESYDADFLSFLGRLTPPTGRFTAGHVQQVRVVWESIKSTLGPSFALPASCPTPDDALQLSWTQVHYHVSIDVYPDGDGDWFARDRHSGNSDAGEIVAGADLPVALVRHLDKFKPI
jgi:hypothetical protein